MWIGIRRHKRRAGRDRERERRRMGKSLEVEGGCVNGTRKENGKGMKGKSR